jgi:septal ring factor EnvC (AmiA/AmiB activator)
MQRKQTETENLNRSITQRQELLNKRAVALYRWQRGGSSLAALNGDVDLATALRRKRYFEAVVSFDRDMVLQLQEEGRRQEVLRAEVAQKKDQLAVHKLALGIAKVAVGHEAEKKKILLASLRQEKDSRLRALREMEAAAQRLQKMLDAIAKRTVIRPRETPSPGSPGTGLDGQRGRLEWPVRGDVSAPFGKFQHPEFAAEIVRKGIDIDAAPGESIKSVEKGRVVFADRFSGYGKMVIVDHGERYYTIYGHLSEIYKKNGDEIRRGEALGRIGDEAWSSRAPLYFEMRKDGKSIDPIPWFSKR